ncbi:hypothetical protein AXK59_20620 [Tsukamurella tyrosinosolvens]|nr:hypothetical protein AXK59_20620 [Tsukamurella tyrosinosolvens]KZL94537.1 hypothetical protein AXX05_08830 [Tsukamurella tyrosinosolvens]
MVGDDAVGVAGLGGCGDSPDGSAAAGLSSEPEFGSGKSGIAVALVEGCCGCVDGGEGSAVGAALLGLVGFGPSESRSRPGRSRSLSLSLSLLLLSPGLLES